MEEEGHRATSKGIEVQLRVQLHVPSNLLNDAWEPVFLSGGMGR